MGEKDVEDAVARSNKGEKCDIIDLENDGQ